MQKSFLVALLMIEFFMIGCTAPKIRLFPSQEDPLQEFTLEGKAKQKVLVIPVRGIISNAPREGFIRSRPSMVQEVVAQLRLAAKDENVKAVILKIDSPGGSVTASDILYNEIEVFKERTGARGGGCHDGLDRFGGILYFAAGRLYPGTSHDHYRFHRRNIQAAEGHRPDEQSGHSHRSE